LWSVAHWTMPRIRVSGEQRSQAGLGVGDALWTARCLPELQHLLDVLLLGAADRHV
jgi:hypothetical protein